MPRRRKRVRSPSPDATTPSVSKKAKSDDATSETSSHQPNPFTPISDSQRESIHDVIQACDVTQLQELGRVWNTTLAHRGWTQWCATQPKEIQEAASRLRLDHFAKIQLPFTRYLPYANGVHWAWSHPQVPGGIHVYHATLSAKHQHLESILVAAGTDAWEPICDAGDGCWRVFTQADSFGCRGIDIEDDEEYDAVFPFKGPTTCHGNPFPVLSKALGFPSTREGAVQALAILTQERHIDDDLLDDVEWE